MLGRRINDDLIGCQPALIVNQPATTHDLGIGQYARIKSDFDFAGEDLGAQEVADIDRYEYLVAGASREIADVNTYTLCTERRRKNSRKRHN